MLHRASHTSIYLRLGVPGARSTYAAFRPCFKHPRSPRHDFTECISPGPFLFNNESVFSGSCYSARMSGKRAMGSQCCSGKLSRSHLGEGIRVVAPVEIEYWGPGMSTRISARDPGGVQRPQGLFLEEHGRHVASWRLCARGYRFTKQLFRVRQCIRGRCARERDWMDSGPDHASAPSPQVLKSRL